MSTIDRSITCPQCAGEARHTFDTCDSSSITGCSTCGYTEYHGPEYGPNFTPTRRWLDQKEAGYGVITVMSSDPLQMISILRCSSEQEFSEAMAAVFDQGEPDYLWAEAARWNPANQTSELIRSINTALSEVNHEHDSCDYQRQHPGES